MRVLNIGGGFRKIPIPPHYADCEMVWLDVDPATEPDLLLDARDLCILDGGQYDGVYGSHILEHFAPHDLRRVLAGVLHVLRDGGFAEFRVPDVLAAMRAAVERGLYAKMYLSRAGPVRARDMLWGYAPYVETYGDCQAHHNGFTADSLGEALHAAGFGAVYTAADYNEVRAVAGIEPLSDEMLSWLRVTL